MGNLPSCVECMDDDGTFPRNPGMCDSVSMKPLPSNSTNGGTSSGIIPFTTETTEDIVQISTMKPLGVTLCDSDSTSGVFVTAIKPEGNVAKLTQPVSVGMLLLELNGVDVTKETLDNVIKAISDSPAEKRLILKFSGTKPVEKEKEESAASTTATATDTDSAEKKKVESSEKKESTEKKEKETNEDNAPTPSQVQEEGEKKVEQEQEKEKKQEEKKEKAADTGVESGKTQDEETWEKVSTPENESFGDFSSPDPSKNTSDDTMDTVEISTPPPQVLKSGGKEEEGTSQENLDNEFSNVNLGDDDDEDDNHNHNASASSSASASSVEEKQHKESDKQAKQQTTSTSSSATASTPQPGSADEVLACHQCHTDLPKTAFSASQLKKKTKRKCKDCMQHASS